MIKDILTKLTEEQRAQLMHAFENGFDQHIELDDNKFIGVNIQETSNLVIEERAGDWSYGSYNEQHD